MPCRSAPASSSRSQAGPAVPIPCEVVGFSGGHALLMPFAPLEGVRRGCRAVVSSVRAAVRPSQAWLGRVVNAMGEPIDGKGPLPSGPAPYPFRASPPAAHARQRVGAPIDLGVRALNTFITCCHGQRMGIFAGSGVGKSVLLSMLARNVVRRCRGDRADRRTRPRGAGVPPGRSRRGRPGPLGRGGGDLRRAGADAPPGRLSDAGDRRILPRPGPARAAADGLGDALRHGAARDRACRRRAADRQGLHADRVHRAAAAAGARRHRAGRGHHHRGLHGAGRRRRPQRADRRRGARASSTATS